MRTQRVHLRLSEEEFARLEAMEQKTQRKKQDVLRLLLRQATVSVSPDVTLVPRGGSTNDVTRGFEADARGYHQTHGGT
jgi:butyrate kinase